MKKTIIALVFLASRTWAVETINFLSSNADTEQQAVIRYLMDAFELENPGIEVDLIFYNENDLPDDILQTGRNIDPHLIMADSRLLMRLSYRRGMDHSFTCQLMNTLGNDMYKGTVEAFTGTEGCFGLPYSAWLQVLWYRKDWFGEKGLQPPGKVEDILSAAESFYSPENGRYGIIIGKDKDSYLEQCFLHIASAEGFNLKKDGDFFTLDETELNTSIDRYQNLSRFTPPGAVNWRYRDFFMQNRAAMLLYSTFLMDDLAMEKIMADSLTGDNFTELEGADYDPRFFNNIGMITTITSEEEASFGSISGIGIFEGLEGEKKDAVSRLIHFLYRPDVYISWLHMSPGGMLPVKGSILEEDDYFRDHTGVFSRYGRRRIITLVESLDFLKIPNPEELMATPGNEYEDRDFLNLIYESINAPGITRIGLSEKKWINTPVIK